MVYICAFVCACVRVFVLRKGPDGDKQDRIAKHTTGGTAENAEIEEEEKKNPVRGKKERDRRTETLWGKRETQIIERDSNNSSRRNNNNNSKQEAGISRRTGNTPERTGTNRLG